MRVDPALSERMGGYRAVGRGLKLSVVTCYFLLVLDRPW